MVFLLVVIGVFQTIFAGARPLMDGVAAAIQTSGKWIEATMPDTPLRSLIVDGVWSGVGSVIVGLGWGALFPALLKVDRLEHVEPEVVEERPPA